MRKHIFGVDRNVFLLGVVSFLTDVSSEMIFSVFSVFFTVILGASTALLGLIEGLADLSASSLDYVAGFLSDKTGKRKIFAVIGYGFSTAAKTMILTANSVVLASIFRVMERFGKSFRGPPRDAWISSLSAKTKRGYSFGIHKTLDKAGAIVGPLIAYALLISFGQSQWSFQLLFLIALIPAMLSVILLRSIPEKTGTPVKKEKFFRVYWTLSEGFRHYLRSAGIFSLAYFSFAFLLLKSYSVGFAIQDIALLYALFNGSFVVFAVPIGKLGDKIGRSKIIIAEYVIYALMSLGFIFAQTKLEIVGLFVIYGMFYSIDASQTKAYITDLEKDKPGTAIGFYNFITGLVYLPASLVAGVLWKINPTYTFAFSAIVSIGALGYFLRNPAKSPLKV